MMNGITILAEEVIYGWPAGVSSFFIIGLVLFFLGMIFSAILLEVDFFHGFFVLVAILGGIICIGSIIYGNNNEIPDYTKYKVLIDDEVNLNEFLNEYEILEQEGQIYSIKEIETVCD